MSDFSCGLPSQDMIDEMVGALNDIEVLHKVVVAAGDPVCGVCLEDWPCPTWQLAHGFPRGGRR